MVEPSTADPEKIDDAVMWVVHGSSLLRCTHEQLRPETPEERNQREKESDDFNVPGRMMDRISDAMHQVRGPVSYIDLRLSGKPSTEARDLEEPIINIFKKPRREYHAPTAAAEAATRREEKRASTATSSTETGETPWLRHRQVPWPLR